MKLIVTIPAYNEAPTIGAVIREIPRRIDGIDSVEVLVIDDGSRDATVQEAMRAGADYVVSNKLNRAERGGGSRRRRRRQYRCG